MKFKVLSVYFVIFSGFGCAQKMTSRDRMEESNSSSKAHPATYFSDAFYFGYRSPADRETPQAGDFFYKHCKLVGHDLPAPSRSDWECSDP